MFTWTHPDDESVTITLPEMGDVPGGVFRAVRRMNDQDAIFTVFESVADADTIAAIDALPIRMVGELFKAWTGGVGPGESGGSST
jgi:hypothetical protein